MQSLDQKMRLKTVQLAVVEPLTRLYSPPMHIRDNQDAQQEYLRTLAEKLMYYSEDALKKGWEEYKEQASTWAWPSIKTLVDCVRKYAEKSGTGQGSGGQWGCALDKAEKMVKLYMQREHEGLAAGTERWAWVREVAFMQANAILGAAVGYQSMVLKTDAYCPEWEDIRQMLKDAKESGQIAVRVPHWAEMRLDVRPRAAETALPTANTQ